MLGKGWISTAVFLVTSALVLGFFLWRNRALWQTKARVRNLGVSPRDRAANGPLGKVLRDRLPVLGSFLLPTTEDQRNLLRRRLIEAGIYDRHALAVLLAVKLLLMVGGAVFAGALVLMGVLSARWGIYGSVIGVGLGMLAPGIWLDYNKKNRQGALRRALPDFLDMLVLCLEGGVSLTGAMQRVTGELQSAHPLLGAELDLVQREMMLGVTVGEGMQKLAERAGVEELHNLATIMIQSERFGTSIVKALRIHADTLRQHRQQRAEELAQKAAVKILFPTLLCIFPAIFIVILGPAVFQLITIFAHSK